jgi:RHS repeat-associated protein
LILERYALGIRGDALIQGITGHSPAFITLQSSPSSTAATSVNQMQIRLNTRFTNSDTQNNNRATFDIDQDGQTRATTDALLMVRYLRGQLGIALTNDATNPSGSRGISSSDTGTTLANKIAAIQGYLDTLCSPQANGETITYFHTDLVGSPVAATDASGSVIWRESYRAYGDRLTNQPNNGTPSDRNVLHFSNKKTEALKGGAVMSYFGARYYDPAAGRFLAVDPMYFTEQSIHSFNRYAYANNNPYRFVDPDGNIPLDTILDIGSIIYDAGKALGATAAYIHGAIAGDATLKSVAAQGLREHGADLGISVGAALTPYASAGMIKGGIKVVDDLPSTIYKRPSGATTVEQRASVQGKPCVDCGVTTAKQYADHKTPLVVEHYKTGGIDKQRMRSVDAVQPQCPTCSSRQGGILSQYSKEMKDSISK